MVRKKVDSGRKLKARRRIATATLVGTAILAVVKLALTAFPTLDEALLKFGVFVVLAWLVGEIALLAVGGLVKRCRG